MSDEICIGIDLGTTNSVIAYYNPLVDGVEIIPNRIGDRLTPSCVVFENNEILVGRTAIEAKNEDNQLISNVKRFIGQKQNNCKDFLDNLEYKIVIDHNGNPLIPIKDYKYKPEEISAHVLAYLKVCAEEFLNLKITDVVITVPAYFNDAQRRATKDACTIAGMNCLRLVAEPTAACLCYGLHKNNRETVLVFDLGGGTFDVSIINLRDGIFETIATGGDTQLGGADIDQLLLNFIIEKYKEYNGVTDGTHVTDGTNEVVVPEILNQGFAESIKKTLSNVPQATIRLVNFKYVITRQQLEDLMTPIVDRCLELVEMVLTDAKKKIPDIDISQIVLVGGCTRIPLVQTKLKEMFGNNVCLNKSVNPDEAVAYGAAVQASILKQIGSKARELLLLDVTPLSLGIETSGGLMNPIIKRNSTLPCNASKMYSTIEDNQQVVDIKVYQGERQFTKDCILLGTFTLEGLQKRPRGVPKIKVEFKLDCDGLLEVSAVDKITGLANQITIKAESNLSPEEVTQLLEEAEKYRTIDTERRQAIEEIERFEKYIYEIQRIINLPENVELLGQNLSLTNQYLMNTIDWMIANRNEKLDIIQNAKITVEYNLKPYLTMIYSHKESLEKSGIKINNDHKEQDLEDIIKDII
jgi:molecular chaperone DnaK (HSP70)